MIITIQLNIELEQDEINLLRKYYLDKHTRQFWNPIKVYNQHKPDLRTQETLTAKKLTEKDILKEDNMFNFGLTQTGFAIMDKIDRDKIIDNILK